MEPTPNHPPQANEPNRTRSQQSQRPYWPVAPIVRGKPGFQFSVRTFLTSTTLVGIAAGLTALYIPHSLIILLGGLCGFVTVVTAVALAISFLRPAAAAGILVATIVGLGFGCIAVFAGQFQLSQATSAVILVSQVGLIFAATLGLAISYARVDQ